nr:hypothetical protein C2W62_06090 [Candidatus Entotheonella serta]
MKACTYSMPEACSETSSRVETVQVEVAAMHPLLLLKQALPWEAITETMTRHWRECGKNVDGGPGLPWDVSLYVPLLVLMLIQRFHPRQMEAYVAENVVARVFIGRHQETKAQIRDHSNIARAYVALGQAGIEDVNGLIVKEAHRFGFVDEGVISADTTAQELPIGYPNEPGILRGLSQRCGRALKRLQERGVAGLEGALQQVETILRSVKDHHLFTKGRQEKREVLVQLLTEVGDLMVQTRPFVEGLAVSSDQVMRSARSRLAAMHDVIQVLMGQIVHWVSTGQVAANKIVHVGIPQARAIVRTQRETALVGCRGSPGADSQRAGSDRRGDRDVEKRSVSIQQAQRATLAHAEDGRAEVYLVIQFEQIDARCRGLDQVGNWEMRWNWNRNEGKRVREQKGWRSR